MSKPDELIPIGIDLGSLHARVAIGNIQDQHTPSEGFVDTKPLPSIISNAQGSRYTLALVGVDKSNVDGDPEKKSSGEDSHIFGEAARRALARDKKPSISKDPSSLVRELVRSCSAMGGIENGKESGKEMDQKASKAASFFGHLAKLACDASSAHPSKLRAVVSVHVDSTLEEQEGIVQSVERGIGEALAARKPEEGQGKKKKKDKDEEDDGVVVGIITDPAAICVAHGLTEMNHSDTIDLASPKGRESTSNWKNVLVVDWGASGLTVTHLRRTSTKSSLLTVVSYASESSCSGTDIVNALVAHCASMFERKNRVTGVLDSVKAHHRLEMACEAAVRTLTRAPTVTVAVDGLYEGMDMSVPISRPRFDMMVSGILRKAEALLQSFAGSGAEGGNSEFDIVLLAGNVCDMPAVTTLIRTKLFPNASRGRNDVSPDEAVAIGCARHAASVLSCHTHSKSGGKTSDGKEGVGPATRKIQMCPLSIGILCRTENREPNSDLEEVISKNAIPLIEMGAPLPANITQTITCSNADESWLSKSSLEIVQIKGGAAPTSKVIGKIENLPKHAKSFELTMELSLEGRLTLAINGGKTCTL